MQPCNFIDPTRITERLFSGPHFIRGYRYNNRLFSQDRKTMWFQEIVSVAFDEGFNYEGHKIA